MRDISKNRFLAVAALLVFYGPAAAESIREQGLAAFDQGRYSVALAKFTEASQDPKDTRARVYLALTQAALNDCKAALPNLTSNEIPDEPVLRKLAGLAAAKCYQVSGETARAGAILEALPKDADVLYALAKLHMKAFNDATYAMFERTPSSYRVHELSGEIFEVENRYTEAVAEYRKAIAQNMNAPELHFRLGRAILLQAHTPEALEQAAAEFQSELKLSPEDGACEFQLGQIAQVQGHREQAKEHFERAVSLSPAYVEALIALGKLRSQDKQNAEAIQVLEQATHLQPTNERAHYALLTAYRNAGEIEKAKQEKDILDRLQKPPEGEFSDFLKRLGEKQPEQ